MGLVVDDELWVLAIVFNAVEGLLVYVDA